MARVIMFTPPFLLQPASGLTDRVSAASVKAGAAGASRATARGAVDVTAKFVGCIR
jgi:hypothetical protein